LIVYSTPSRLLSISIRAVLSEKEPNRLERRCKDRGNTRSPTKFDEEGNPITIEEDSKTGASNAREAYD
jgi:hypothetical protein